MIASSARIVAQCEKKAWRSVSILSCEGDHPGGDRIELMLVGPSSLRAVR